MFKIGSLAAAVVTLAGCAGGATAPDRDDLRVHPVQQATLWMQTSGEYRASALQAWRAAAHTLDAALADPGWTAALEQSGDTAGLPPAIIVDADETVIDNSPFEAQLVRDGASYDTERWARWVEARRATAVPGALEFLRDAARRGVTVFYVTNRDHSGERATRDNLRALGFPLDASRDVVLTRGENGWGSDKSARRALVAESHRIVMMAGDDMNDFVSGTRADVATRLAVLERHAGWWGERWIVLPNPMYGSWERALYGFESNLSESERQRRRLEALRP